MLNSATARLAFLISLAHSGNVTISAEFAGISRSSLYSWRLQDAEFAESWDCAMHESLDRLKEAARRRAIYGIDEPYFYHGEQVAVRRRYSDGLLIYLLKAASDSYQHTAPSGTKGSDGAVDDDAISPDSEEHLYQQLEEQMARLLGTDEPGPADQSDPQDEPSSDEMPDT